MSQWKNDDSAANSVLWGVVQYNKTANSANQTDFFGNTTADAYVTNLTVGQFGVDTSEQSAARAAGAKPAHAGWVVKTTGSGGRAGRVMYETIVAMGSMTADSEDTAFPDYTLAITSNPSSASANSTDNEIATFTVAGSSTPSGATLSYYWQKWDGSAFANLSNAGAYSNTTTATLSVLANTASNGEIYRGAVATTGATTVFSSNAVITITT